MSTSPSAEPTCWLSWQCPLLMCHAQKASTTRRWCDPLPYCMKNRSRYQHFQTEVLPIIGFTLSQRESYASSGVKLPPPHGIVTQTSPLHVGVAELAAICKRRACSDNSCSRIDGVSCQRDGEGHRGRFINWSRGRGGTPRWYRSEIPRTQWTRQKQNRTVSCPAGFPPRHWGCTMCQPSACHHCARSGTTTYCKMRAKGWTIPKSGTQDTRQTAPRDERRCQRVRRQASADVRQYTRISLERDSWTLK